MKGSAAWWYRARASAVRPPAGGGERGVRRAGQPFRRPAHTAWRISHHPPRWDRRRCREASRRTRSSRWPGHAGRSGARSSGRGIAAASASAAPPSRTQSRARRGHRAAGRRSSAAFGTAGMREAPPTSSRARPQPSPAHTRRGVGVKSAGPHCRAGATAHQRRAPVFVSRLQAAHGLVQQDLERLWHRSLGCMVQKRARSRQLVDPGAQGLRLLSLPEAPHLPLKENWDSRRHMGQGSAPLRGGGGIHRAPANSYSSTSPFPSASAAREKKRR